MISANFPSGGTEFVLVKALKLNIVFINYSLFMIFLNIKNSALQ